MRISTFFLALCVSVHGTTTEATKSFKDEGKIAVRQEATTLSTVSESAEVEMWMFMEGLPRKLEKLRFDAITDDSGPVATSRCIDQKDRLRKNYVDDSPDLLEKDRKRFGKGSKCFFKDQEVAQIVDGLTTYPSPSFKRLLDEIKNPRPLAGVHQECRGKSNLEIIKDALTKGDARLGVCRDIPNETKFITAEDYNEEVEKIVSRFLSSMAFIDAWACKYRFTSKSMTYFTLFLRTAGDSRVNSTHINGPKDDSPPIAHFAEYPALLINLFSQAQPDLEPKTKAMIEKLKTQIISTKKLIEALGRSKKGFVGVAKTRCPAVKGRVSVG